MESFSNEHFVSLFAQPAEANRERLIHQIELIDAFIRSIRKRLNKIIRKKTTRKEGSPYSVITHSKMHYMVMSDFLKELYDEIDKYEETHMESIMMMATEMMGFIANNPTIDVDVNAFTEKLADLAAENKDYILLKRKRRALRHKLTKFTMRKVSPDFLSLIRTEFIAANHRYIPELQYSPPSIFDIYIAEFLNRSNVSHLVYPTAKIIAEGNVDSAVYTLSEFCLMVYDQLNVNNAATRSIVYTSVVRFLFDEAYVLKSELRENDQENEIFLLQCEAFSKQTVRDLRLTNDITKNYIPGLQVPSLFKSKQFDLLKPMEIMTNPIDLMKHVHTILGALASHFGSNGVMLSFDDTLTLLLALTSLNPPSNAVSIAKFVDKWNDVQLSSIVGVSKNYFIAAIEQLMENQGA